MVWASLTPGIGLLWLQPVSSPLQSSWPTSIPLLPGPLFPCSCLLAASPTPSPGIALSEIMNGQPIPSSLLCLIPYLLSGLTGASSHPCSATIHVPPCLPQFPWPITLVIGCQPFSGLCPQFSVSPALPVPEPGDADWICSFLLSGTKPGP